MKLRELRSTNLEKRRNVKWEKTAIASNHRPAVGCYGSKQRLRRVGEERKGRRKENLLGVYVKAEQAGRKEGLLLGGAA